MYFTRGQYYQLNHEFAKALKDFKKIPATGRPEIIKKINECELGVKLLKKPIKAVIINLGEGVNSSKNEVLPKITADNKRLFFSSYREGATGGMKHPMDVYYSKKEDKIWGEVVQFKKPINSAYNEACVGLSADGNTMYLYKGDNGGDLFVTSYRGGEWGDQMPFVFNTEAKESSMTISPDGQQLLFVRKENGRSSEIYTSYLSEDSTWSKPVLFELNTPYDEETPCFHADGRTLFYSSKGIGTIGGYDIFFSQKTKNGWSVPINIGYPINTAKDEIGFCTYRQWKNSVLFFGKRRGIW